MMESEFIDQSLDISGCHLDCLTKFGRTALSMQLVQTVNVKSKLHVRQTYVNFLSITLVKILSLI